MRVLHLSGSKSHWSGNEQQLSDLIDNLNELGVKNYIFCYESSAIEKYAKAHNIEVFPQERYGIYSPKLAKQLRNCIKENQIDVLHIHTSNFLTVFMVADLLYRLKIPTVFSRKGFSEKSSFLSALKYNYKNIDRTICVSGAVKEGLKNFVKPENHHKLRVIYDGIRMDLPKEDAPENLREKYNLSLDTILIGNIANHVPAKDLVTLLNTVHQLVNILKINNVHFIQIGKKTDHTEEYIKLAKELNVEKYITFTGQISNAKNYIPQLDIFFMSSQSEGLPLTIYESFLAKKPVVSTKAGGIPEAITNGENGFLCEIKDAECLARQLELLVKDASLREKMAENAFKVLIDKFDAKKCASETYHLYQEVIDLKK